MMTEQEQMDRFEAAVKELYALQRKQMHRHMGKGGWEDSPIDWLVMKARIHSASSRNRWHDETDEEALLELADAANYLVMAFDRIREEGDTGSPVLADAGKKE